MLRIFTWIIFCLQIFGILLYVGYAITGKEETNIITPIEYYVKAILNVPFLIWLYYIMQNLGYL